MKNITLILITLFWFNLSHAKPKDFRYEFGLLLNYSVLHSSENNFGSELVINPTKPIYAGLVFNSYVPIKGILNLVHGYEYSKSGYGFSYYGQTSYYPRSSLYTTFGLNGNFGLSKKLNLCLALGSKFSYLKSNEQNSQILSSNNTLAYTVVTSNIGSIIMSLYYAIGFNYTNKNQRQFLFDFTYHKSLNRTEKSTIINPQNNQTSSLTFKGNYAGVKLGIFFKKRVKKNQDEWDE